MVIVTLKITMTISNIGRNEFFFISGYDDEDKDDEVNNNNNNNADLFILICIPNTCRFF